MLVILYEQKTRVKWLHFQVILPSINTAWPHPTSSKHQSITLSSSFCNIKKSRNPKIPEILGKKPRKSGKKQSKFFNPKKKRNIYLVRSFATNMPLHSSKWFTSGKVRFLVEKLDFCYEELLKIFEALSSSTTDYSRKGSGTDVVEVEVGAWQIKHLTIVASANLKLWVITTTQFDSSSDLPILF